MSQPDLGTDLELRHPHEHVERVGDPAVGGVLQRHDAEIDVAAVDFLEHRRMLPTRDELDRLAEALDGGQVAVTVFRAEICDLEDLLQGPRAADDLAEDGPDGVVVERPLVGFEDVLKTSSSRAGEKTSSPWSFLTLPISAARPARSLTSLRICRSSLSIWVRRFLSERGAWRTAAIASVFGLARHEWVSSWMAVLPQFRTVIYCQLTTPGVNQPTRDRNSSPAFRCPIESSLWSVAFARRDTLPTWHSHGHVKYLAASLESSSLT